MSALSDAVNDARQVKEAFESYMEMHEKVSRATLEYFATEMFLAIERIVEA